jgi:serralysin
MTTLCVGTDGPDTLYGTYKRDGMDAGQGDDLLYGRKGRDIMKGDTGGQQDTTDGNDQVYGNRGDDWLLGYGATTC